MRTQSCLGRPVAVARGGPSEQAELLLEIVADDITAPPLSRCFDHVADQRDEACRFDLRNCARWRRRIEESPAGSVEVHLHPRVDVSLTDGVEASEPVVNPADEARYVPGRNAERSQKYGHRGRIELAVASVRLEEEVVERVFRRAGGRLEVVPVFGAQVLFDRLRHLSHAARIAGPGLRPLDASIGELWRKRQVPPALEGVE